MTLAAEDWFSLLVIVLAAAVCISAAVYAIRHHGKARSRTHLVMAASVFVLLVLYVLYLIDVIQMGSGGGYWLMAGIALVLAGVLGEIIVDL